MATRSLPAGEGPRTACWQRPARRAHRGPTTGTSEHNCIPDLRTQPQRTFQNPHQGGLWCWRQCNMPMKVRDLGRRLQNLLARCQEAVRGQEDVN